MFNHWKHGWQWPEDDEQMRERGRKARARAKRKFKHFMNEGGSWRRPKYNIPVNVIERETEYELMVHAVTYPKEHIKVSVVDDMLYISGTREPKEDRPNFVLQEYPIKSFERSFELSHKVDKDNISAKFVDGILVVTVPKTEAAQKPEVNIDIQ
ncbi:MAG: Hsp20/alpha crystallin family protein [Bacteroidia bacterium]|nr:Hsp20/alpha crystallin family protein [Bacteroidia bacterium]